MIQMRRCVCEFGRLTHFPIQHMGPLYRLHDGTYLVSATLEIDPDFNLNSVETDHNLSVPVSAGHLKDKENESIRKMVGSSCVICLLCLDLKSGPRLRGDLRPT